MRRPRRMMGFDSSGGGTGVLAPPKPRTRRIVPGCDESRRRRRSQPPPPPEDPGDPGDRGGGGGGGDGERPRPGGASPGPDVYRFALALAMAGISTIFAVFLVVWLRFGRNAPGAAPDGLFDLPLWVWTSTLALLASSVTLHRAARARRKALLVASLALGAVFLVSQLFLWSRLVERGLAPSAGGTMATLYAVTGLHALHVVGGLLVMVRTLTRALRGLQVVESIRLCATYWHFMGLVWVVIFAAFAFTR